MTIDPDTPFSRLYPELRRIAARSLASERPGHTLQPTALIHEAYLRLHAGAAPDWQGRTHFMAVAATTIRRILVDYARGRRAVQRGGDAVRVPLDKVEKGVTCHIEEVLAIDEALCELEAADARAARVTELRFFAGFEETEIAKELGISVITVKRDWKFARAWLAARLAR